MLKDKAGTKLDDDNISESMRLSDIMAGKTQGDIDAALQLAEKKKLLEHFQARQRTVLKNFEKKVKDKGFEVVQVQVGDVVIVLPHELCPVDGTVVAQVHEADKAMVDAAVMAARNRSGPVRRSAATAVAAPIAARLPWPWSTGADRTKARAKRAATS